MALYRSPLTVTLWLSSFLKKYGPMIPPVHKAHQTSENGDESEKDRKPLNPVQQKKETGVLDPSIREVLEYQKSQLIAGLQHSLNIGQAKFGTAPAHYAPVQVNRNQNSHNSHSRWTQESGSRVKNLEQQISIPHATSSLPGLTSCFFERDQTCRRTTLGPIRIGRTLSVMSRRKQRSAFDQVSEFDRGRIGAYRDCGLSFREIGSRVGRNQITVMRICERWMQEGTTNRRGRSHPSQCTTSREDRQILRRAVTDDSVTSRTVAQHIESVTHHSVSARTIRRRLQQSGLSARRPFLVLDAESQTYPPPMVR
ncbi:uncharacterized protein TNCV_3638291 [Trichonephila clavipes]|nr:uncharacterized protein TNCV_3638291 [Trichonephila clavipes]